jgi:hypothetical protein
MTNDIKIHLGKRDCEVCSDYWHHHHHHNQHLVELGQEIIWWKHLSRSRETRRRLFKK